MVSRTAFPVVTPQSRFLTSLICLLVVKTLVLITWWQLRISSDCRLAVVATGTGGGDVRVHRGTA